MKLLINSLLILGLLNLVACSKPGKEAMTPDNSSPQTGFVTGKVVDSQGKPLAGAEIIVENATYYNSTANGRSDANGNYKIEIPSGPMSGAWYVHGSVKLTFENQTYKLNLATNDNATFSSSEGAVRNLQLKLSGERTNYGDSGNYGATVEVDNRTSDEYVRSTDIELTLEPVVLIDGSAGQTIVAKANGLYIRDIPLGHYKVSARQISQNKPLTVRLRLGDQDYQSSTDSMFLPILAGSDRYQMDVEVSN